jgi:hypothetical protein
MDTIRQLYRSRVKKQELFDQIFNFLSQEKKGKMVNKGMVVDSTYLCKAFMQLQTGGATLNTPGMWELTEGCRRYIGNYPMTMLVND